MADLIITNGDTAADLLGQAGRAGTIVPWRDVLHEGPIKAAPLEVLSAERAAFLAGRFRLPEAEVLAGFAERDAAMRDNGRYERIELWFEHDLYDQLQLVQILAFFAGAGRSDGLALVQADDFLGRQTAETILRFADLARPVEADDLDLCEAVWADLAMPTPDFVARRVEESDDRLPFLMPALQRFLEELPAPGSGLGRAEAVALTALAHRPARGIDLFHAALAAEEAAFMGDLSFFALLDDLAFCRSPLISGLSPSDALPDPLLRFRTDRLALTERGEEVLSGRTDRITLEGIDRWWAGTHLTTDACWRYDRDEMRLLTS